MPIFDDRAIVLATLGASLLLFVTDALRYDLVAVLVVLVLAGTGCLEPTEAFGGFSSPAIVLIASMYVFGHAMTRWGVAEFVGQRLIGPSKNESVLALRVSLVAGLLSSVLSNTGVVASLIPVLAAVSRRSNVPLSRLLVPLSFGSLLGGMLSVIGTSTNVAINEAVRKANVAAADVAGGIQHEPFSLFEFSHFGLICLVVGCLYLWSPFRKLLPRSRESLSLSEHYHVTEFVTEVLVEPSSTLINRTVMESGLLEQHGASVLGIVRAGEDSVLAPGPYNRIRADDTLVLQGEPEAILRVREELGLKERKSAQLGDVRLSSDDVQLVEAVIPVGSSLLGRTLVESEFRADSGLNVLGVSKQGDVRASSLMEQPLEVGDSLLLQGHEPDIERAGRARDVLILGSIQTRNLGRGALVTLFSLALVIICAALNWLPLSVAALGGASLLVLTGTVQPDEVRRTMDWSVLILIGGMVSLGEAFQRHGLGASVAQWMVDDSGAGQSPYLLLGVLLIATTGLCQLINHVTAAVIMTPVALSFADELMLSDRPFLMAVVVGANLCFMSPVAHQANAMVMGPGDYRFKDFLKVGSPLTVVLLLVAMLLLPLLWPFVG